MSETVINRAILVGLFLCHSLSWGQPIYFDRTYDIDNMTERVSNALHSNDGGYRFFKSGNQNIEGEGSRLSFYELDEHGEPLFIESVFEDSSRLALGYVVEASDGNMVCFYSKSTYQHNFNFFLRKISTSGELLWEREFGDSLLTSAPVHVIEVSDRGFLLIGQEASSDDGDMHVIKTDSFGILEWEKSFGGSLFDCGNSAIELPEGGFLILGWTRSFGAGQRDFYLVKTDSLGNQEWQRTYGDGNNQSPSGIIAVEDGNYLMAGGAGNGPARMIKADPDGNVIWQRNYSHPESTGGSNYLFQSIELADGRIAACGLTNNTLDGDAGWLILTDATGNLQWQRKYNRNQFTDLFYHVLATDDGGFLLSGQAIVPENSSQDAWLLKVDSVGCTYADCLVGVDELNSSKVVADVWPNPADQFINIEWQRQGEAEIRLLDMTGKEILRKQSHDQREAMDVSHLPNGLYLLNLVQGEVKSSLKVVVQH
jgi:hypothetical protein